MPRDTNGNYNLPEVGNPVVPGTRITADWANPTLEDVAQAMQDSLSRSGQGGMQAPLGFLDSSGIVPGFNFVSESTTGIKRVPNEDMRMQVTGTEVLQAIKTGVKVLTPNSGGVLKHPVVEESGLNVMRGEGGTTIVYFFNETAPTGWTIMVPDANVRELLIGPGGPGNGGTIGGTTDPFNLTQSITVNITGVAADSAVPHTHTYSGTTAAANTPAFNLDQGVFGAVTISHTHDYTGTTGPATDTTHGHLVTGSGVAEVSIGPRYARGILATLNA